LVQDLAGLGMEGLANMPDAQLAAACRQLQGMLAACGAGGP
jgi:hypothetical protein